MASFADLAIIAPGFLLTHANNSSVDENNAAGQQCKIHLFAECKWMLIIKLLLHLQIYYQIA
ncbi:hypothetical protein DBR37_00580 [Herminiimonas sp. KBW02]|nr:hypothetical protein DBR37_00580 [Herminiimonas sp. KBW02]